MHCGLVTACFFAFRFATGRYAGLIYAANHKWENATDLLRKAVDIRQNLKQVNLSMEPLAGLVEIALARHDLESAQAEAESILAHLDNDPDLAGPNEPFRVHLIAYRYLKELKDKRAPNVLRRAHKILQERAEKISSPTMRESYLSNVVANREIIRQVQSFNGSH